MIAQRLVATRHAYWRRPWNGARSILTELARGPSPMKSSLYPRSRIENFLDRGLSEVSSMNKTSRLEIGERAPRSPPCD